MVGAGSRTSAASCHNAKVRDEPPSEKSSARSTNQRRYPPAVLRPASQPWPASLTAEPERFNKTYPIWGRRSRRHDDSVEKINGPSNPPAWSSLTV